MELRGLDSKFTLPPLGFVVDNDIAVKSMKSYGEPSCSDFYEDELDYLYDSYRDSTMREYCIKEIGQWDQLGYSENDLTFLQEQIRKQPWPIPCLSEDEEPWDSPRMDPWLSASEELRTALLNEDEDSWGQMSPMEWYSDQGSSSKYASPSDSSKMDQQEMPQQKSRHCRHFLKGRCERGNTCGFRHDISVFCTDMQKVFLGGLPQHMTSSLLRQKLSEQGYKVL